MAILEQKYPNILPVSVFGLRRVEVAHILHALETGADGVLLAMCPWENDPFPEIREVIRKRVDRAADLVKALGLDEGRVQLYEMPREGLLDRPFITDFVKKIE
jgi:coenzyme F420-reducing hydrogenase delta subunit